MDRYFEFINDVESNPDKYPLTIKQLVVLQCKVLDSQDDDDYPYYFDERVGQEVVNFLEKLKQSKDRFRGKFLVLQPWQVFLVGSVYGTKKKENGFRKYKEAYDQMSRKMGKTFLGAGLSLYHISKGDGEECYSIATMKEQAKITYDAMCQMIKQIPNYEKFITIHQSKIFKNDSVYKPMSAEDNTSDGLNPSFVLVDEYHAHKDNKLYNVYEDGMGARSEPLMFIITTAGYNKGACFDEYLRCKKVLSGEIVDETLFPMIWELDEDDDWEDESVWHKSNPNLDTIVSREWLRDKYNKAVQKPDQIPSFKTKNLNLWTSDNTDTWIDTKTWERCKREYDEDELIGRRCYAGIDLAGVRDLTGYTLYFPMDDGSIIAKHKVYVPEASIEGKARLENIHFPDWVQTGFVTATAGEVTDHKVLIDDIVSDSNLYEIIEIGYDPHKSGNIISFLEQEGLTLLPIAQGIVKFSQPCKDWEASVVLGRIIDNNPVMEWCISNTVIKPNHHEDFIPLKKDGKKTNKIDLVISSVIAHQLLSENEEGFRVVKSNPIDLWADELDEKDEENITIRNDNSLDLWAEDYSN